MPIMSQRGPYTCLKIQITLKLVDKMIRPKQVTKGLVQKR